MAHAYLTCVIWPIERLDQFFEANEITQEKEVATLLSVMGTATYGTLTNVVQPRPTETHVSWKWWRAETLGQQAFQWRTVPIRNGPHPHPKKIPNPNPLTKNVRFRQNIIPTAPSSKNCIVLVTHTTTQTPTNTHTSERHIDTHFMMNNATSSNN